MKSADVFFRSVTEIKEFVNIVSDIKGDVTLSDQRHSVDAKSIMGIFCLNLTRVLEREIDHWDERYESMLAKYIVMYH